MSAQKLTPGKKNIIVIPFDQEKYPDTINNPVFFRKDMD